MHTCMKRRRFCSGAAAANEARSDSETTAGASEYSTDRMLCHRFCIVGMHNYRIYQSTLLEAPLSHRHCTENSRLSDVSCTDIFCQSLLACLMQHCRCCDSFFMLPYLQIAFLCHSIRGPLYLEVCWLGFAGSFHPFICGGWLAAVHSRRRKTRMKNCSVVGRAVLVSSLE